MGVPDLLNTDAIAKNQRCKGSTHTSDHEYLIFQFQERNTLPIVLISSVL